MNDPNFASCTVDNTPYVKSDSMQDMIKKLENDLIKFWEQFYENKMKNKNKLKTQ